MFVEQLKSDHNQWRFVNSVESFCLKKLKVSFEQLSSHNLSDECHVSLKMGAGFVTVVLSLLMPKKRIRPWGGGWVEIITVNILIRV